MTQTFALFLDAYRELNSKKLFWITLILSALVIGIFAFLGVSGSNLTYAGMTLPMGPTEPIYFYKLFFSMLVIGIWLTWAAIALAIISTAGLFPDLISGGTIDLYLSKPMGRLRLFLTKYLTGLLFVSLQVSVFALFSFVIFGFRGHEWRPSIFLAIPLTVVMFSYLFAFCVLIGVWTRSTVAAILLTVIFWFACWGVQKADSTLLGLQVLIERMNERVKSDAAFDDGILVSLPKDHPRYKQIAADRQRLVIRQQDLEHTLVRYHFLHRIAAGFNAVVPKTTDTTNLLDRYLFSDDEAIAGQTRSTQRRPGAGSPFGADDDVVAESGAEIQGIVRSASPWFIIGTSLLSEAVIVGIAAWIFCRRDY